MARQTKRRSVPEVGSLVLLGTPGITMPGEWFLGRLLWTDGTECLFEHSDLSGTHRYRQVLAAEHIRAAGTIPELGAYQRRCEAEIRKLARRVHERERQLADARAAVYRALEKLAEG